MSSPLGLSAPTLDDESFNAIRKLVYDRFGINLTEQKQSLVSSRLQGVLRNKGYSSYTQLIDYLKKDSSGQSLVELVNRISTNYSYFYRESDHFKYFSDMVLPWVLETEASSKDMRIWIAGCSTGEEPFTLTMVMREKMGQSYGQWDTNILATDISRRALAEARKAEYGEDRIHELPDIYRKKYLQSVGPERFKISPQITENITFRGFNLMNEHLPFKKKFHAIFCRNVMIYFDNPTREALVNRFANQLLPGGYLFIGHSESIGRDHPKLSFIKPALYRRNGER